MIFKDLVNCSISCSPPLKHFFLKFLFFPYGVIWWTVPTLLTAFLVFQQFGIIWIFSFFYFSHHDDTFLFATNPLSPGVGLNYDINLSNLSDEFVLVLWLLKPSFSSKFVAVTNLYCAVFLYFRYIEISPVSWWSYPADLGHLQQQLSHSLLFLVAAAFVSPCLSWMCLIVDNLILRSMMPHFSRWFTPEELENYDHVYGVYLKQESLIFSEKRAW